MNKNLKELKKTFTELNSDKGKAGLELLEEASFLKETLARLRKQIKEKELTEDMPQGEYSINRSNPLLKTYNTTIDAYRKIMNQIIGILPNEIKPKEDEFEDF